MAGISRKEDRRRISVKVSEEENEGRKRGNSTMDVSDLSHESFTPNLLKRNKKTSRKLG